jgi:uracil-DNA glycosylase
VSEDKQKSLLALYEEYAKDPAFKHLILPGINFVSGVGPLDSKLMLIGEAPGSMENARGMPFIGPAGKILTGLLSDAHINPTEVFMTNTIKFWPKNEKGKTRTPEDEEIQATKDYILREINIIDPKIVGLVGLTSVRTFFPGISDIFTYNGRLLENKFVVLYHPAVVGYRPDKKAVVATGYNCLKTYLENE